MAKTPQIKASQVQRKSFEYRVENIRLEFTLRVDQSNELRHFRAMLEAAMRDIDNELKNIKN